MVIVNYVLILSVDKQNINFYSYSEWQHAESHYGECHYAESGIFICYTEYHYAKCCSARHCPWISLIKYLVNLHGTGYKIT